MATPRLLTSDFTIPADWADGNPDKEDRVGYFVTKDDETSGITINKAISSSEILGVSVEADECPDESTRVGILGIVIVKDDGTCTPNCKCACTDASIATVSTKGFRVIDRIDESHIRIFIEGGNNAQIKASVIDGVLYL